jgi:hypothetical protein
MSFVINRRMDAALMDFLARGLYWMGRGGVKRNTTGHRETPTTTGKYRKVIVIVFD